MAIKVTAAAVDAAVRALHKSEPMSGILKAATEFLVCTECKGSGPAITTKAEAMEVWARVYADLRHVVRMVQNFAAQEIGEPAAGPPGGQT